MGEENKRNKVIEKDKRKGTWHVHYGYIHAENSEKQHNPLSVEDKLFLDKVNKIWHNRNR